MANSLYQYLLALGSNLGDRQSLIQSALAHIQQEGFTLLSTASLYETPPFGGVANQEFLNGACLVETTATPLSFLSTLHKIEERHGRQRTKKWGNRTLDLDILLAKRRIADKWLDVSLVSTHLTIPHPELINRDFFLVPAAEIAGDWIIPGETIQGETIQGETKTLNQLAAPFKLKRLLL